MSSNTPQPHFDVLGCQVDYSHGNSLTRFSQQSEGVSGAHLSVYRKALVATADVGRDIPKLKKCHVLYSLITAESMLDASPQSHLLGEWVEPAISQGHGIR